MTYDVDIEERFREGARFLEQAVGIIAKTGIRIVSLRERYARIMLPFEPNVNHIGTMYGGSLFILAEFSGGVIYYVSFDHSRFYPIVKEVNIRYRAPALTDCFLEVSLPEEEVGRIQSLADMNGKQDWVMDLDIKDTQGKTCCQVKGTWQLRRF